MSLDPATFVGNLDITLPPIGDQIQEGDDHMRTIKTCLKNSFPNVTGVVNAADGDLAALQGSSDIVATPTTLWGVLVPANWNTLSGAGRLGIDGRFHGHLRAQALIAGAGLSSMMKCPSPVGTGAVASFTSWCLRAGVFIQMVTQVYGANFNSIDLTNACGGVQVNDVFYLNWNYHTR